MSHRFSIKQGDTGPPITETLFNADDTTIDLTSAIEVRFHLFTPSRSVLVDAPAVVTDVDGIVTYNWVVGDTDTAGGHLREWQCTLSDGTIITVPNDRLGYETLVTRQGA